MTPEQRAESVLRLIESDFGQSGRDVRLLAIRDEIVAAINDTKDDDAKICKLQIKDWSPTENAKYVAWETAKDISIAIMASKIKE